MSKLLKISLKNYLIYLFWIGIIFGDINLVQKITLSNALAISTGFTAFFYTAFFNFKKSKFILAQLSLIILAATCAYWQFGHQENYLEEFIKMFVVLFGGLSIASLVSSESLEKFLKPLPIILAIYIVYKFFNGLPIHGTNGRFEINSLGSANTTAFILCFAVIILIYSYEFFSFIKWPILLFFSVLIAYTMSRSAIIGLNIGVLFSLLFKRKSLLTVNDFTAISTIIFIMFCTYWIGFLPHFDMVTDIKTTGGDGRVILWSTVSHTIVSSPKAWITGFGPGAISHLNIFNHHYPSIDSFILKFFYSYGIMGFFISCYFCLQLIMPYSDNFRIHLFKNILGIFFVFTLLTNDTSAASQAIFYGMILVGYILSEEKVITYGYQSNYYFNPKLGLKS